MNLFLIILSLITAAVAQQPFLNCNYRLYGGVYWCDLTINNPNGFNNFTDIGGIHLDGFTNARIDYVITLSGVSTNVPRIICDTFPNVSRFDLYDTGLTEIDDSAFSGCSRVIDLYLNTNRISSISANAFVNLPNIRLIALDINLLTTLPENVFASQQSLTSLTMSYNPFEDIPGGVFQPLENLQILQLNYCNLSAINNQWFVSNTRLSRLYLEGNRIAASPDNFVGLNNVTYLYLRNNAISEIQAGAFAQLPNLQTLYLRNNNFTELQANSFPDLEQVGYIDIGENPIDVIHGGAFRGLTITSLDLSSCRIRQLYSNSFEGLASLSFISLNYNQIEELPPSIFVPLPNINYVGLWNNRLKSLRRDSFGGLANLNTLDLNANVVNGLDRAFIDDAVNLDTLRFSGNLCADNYFANFQISRVQYLLMLETCFSNFRYVIDTITEGGDEFLFFEGAHSGIALRVNADNEVQIALTPFNFVWRPMIEIIIGTTNNTRSVIRMNQETDVVTVPTPNIITRNQWNDFRVTWENQVILVYSANKTFPFMGFTMHDFFPVNFYGLRAIGTRASWSVQPFEL